MKTFMLVALLLSGCARIIYIDFKQITEAQSVCAPNTGLATIYAPDSDFYEVRCLNGAKFELKRK